ncbi:MAG: hypothetical protein JSV04_05860 [Candidatus Heimdallarchaeota archaeon]|nr:MAG: hypothetical protein JSV04_05860 [Candidatus Heimdallarchaeota archaeon]
MTKNQTRNNLMFEFKECWQLLKKTDIPRVSKESVHALNKLVTGRALELATRAVTLAAEKGREEVLEEDITKAVTMASPIAMYEVDQEAPVVHYVWFISSGGTCLLSRSYSGLEFPDTIFSGLLTGIIDLMSEVTGRMIEKFSTDDLTIHIRRIGEITVAVICDSEESDPIDELTDILARKFLEVFSEEIQMEVIDTSIFDDFAPVLDVLVAGSGLNIPKERLKIIKKSASLTDRQLEETVDAVALREEIRRAQVQIQDLAVFRKNNEIIPSGEESLIHESPDVTEIKAFLRQASQDIREEIRIDDNSIDDKSLVQDVSREDVIKEISRDFPEIIPKAEKGSAEPTVKTKPKKKTKRRKRRRKR